MDRLAYTSLSALRGAMARQAATANNLANANTVGFRAEYSSARALWVKGAGVGDRAVASEEVAGADMKAGEIKATGRDLDIALNGDAMLAVQAPDGEEGYTRRGDLRASDSGVLTTGDGSLVLGEGGPITLPPADSVRIDEDGAVWVVPAGGDPAQPQQVDRLKLVSPEGSRIAKGLDGLFRVQGGGALPADPEARIVTRSLEGSNVDPTRALVEMIESSRAWDHQLKLVSTARDLDGSAAELMRLPD